MKTIRTSAVEWAFNGTHKIHHRAYFQNGRWIRHDIILSCPPEAQEITPAIEDFDWRCSGGRYFQSRRAA